MNDILNVKAGDEVIYYPSGSYSKPRIVTVDKVTPTGRIKVGSTYYSSAGSEIGGTTWHRTRIGTASPEKVKQIRQDEFIRSVMGLMQDTKTITYEQSIAIEKILKPEVDG